MSKIYYYCDGTTKKSTTVNMTAGACTQYQEYNDGYTITVMYRTKLTFTLSVAAETSLQVRYSYRFIVTNDGVVQTDFVATTATTIPAGVTNHQIYVDCKQETWGAGGDTQHNQY